MTCSEAGVALGRYVLGAAVPASGDDLEAHLRECPSCRDELADLTRLAAVLGRPLVRPLVVAPDR